MPAVIMTSAASVRSEYSPSRICTTEESAAPYWRSVTTAFARLRSRFTTTISRATPRTTLDNRQAEPTAPAPITPIFIWPVLSMRHCTGKPEARREWQARIGIPQSCMPAGAQKRSDVVTGVHRRHAIAGDAADHAGTSVAIRDVYESTTV